MQDNRGVQNTVTGSSALLSNINGSYNTVDGYNALYGNCSNNTAIGLRALSANSTGTENTAVGVSALANTTKGSHRTAIGFEALMTDGRGQNNNIGLGYEAGIDVGGWLNHIEIGNPGRFADNYTTRIGDGQFLTFIAGISGTAVAGNTVVVNANGQLGTATSSARFKKEIKPMDKASEAILELQASKLPVQERSDSDTAIWLNCRRSGEGGSRFGHPGS